MFQRAFSVSTREPAARLFDPGDTPLPGGLLYVQHWYMRSIERLFARMFVRLTCCVSCGIARARSFVCDHGRARRGRPSCRGCVRRAVASLGVAVVTWPWLWRPPSLCRRRVVATRRWMLVFAMVLAVSVLSQFALRLQGVYSESHQANDNERNGDEREATTTETTTARTVTRSPLTGVAWMIEN